MGRAQGHGKVTSASRQDVDPGEFSACLVVLDGAGEWIRSFPLARRPADLVPVAVLTAARRLPYPPGVSHLESPLKEVHATEALTTLPLRRAVVGTAALLSCPHLLEPPGLPQPTHLCAPAHPGQSGGLTGRGAWWPALALPRAACLGSRQTKGHNMP